MEAQNGRRTDKRMHLKYPIYIKCISERGHPGQFQLTFVSYAYQRQKLIS